LPRWPLAVLVYALLIVVAAGVGAAVGLALGADVCVAWRRAPRPAPGVPVSDPVRAAQPLPEPQRAAIGESAVHIHHHWHGVDAEDVAAIIRSQQDGQ
jgi:hypothetical protein